MLIWFLNGVRHYRQIYLEEINSDGAGVDCWIVFKTATKLTSETCTHNVCIDIGVDVYFDIVGMLTLTLMLSRTLKTCTCLVADKAGAHLHIAGRHWHRPQSQRLDRPAWIVKGLIAFLRPKLK